MFTVLFGFSHPHPDLPWCSHVPMRRSFATPEVVSRLYIVSQYPTGKVLTRRSDLVLFISADLARVGPSAMLCRPHERGVISHQNMIDALGKAFSEQLDFCLVILFWASDTVTLRYVGNWGDKFPPLTTFHPNLPQPFTSLALLLRKSISFGSVHPVSP